MGIVFRQSVKTTIVIFLGAVLGAITIWLSTNYISKQELGFVATLTNLAVVATQLLLIGLQNTMAVYIHQYKNDKIKRGVLIATCLLLPLIIIAITTPIYFLLKAHIVPLFQVKDIPFISKYFAWLPVFGMLMMYQVLLESYLVSQVMVAISSFVREVVLRIGNIIIILLFGFNIISFNTFIAATVLMYLLPVTIYAFLCANNKAFWLSLKYTKFSKSELKEIFQFTWYHSLISISITLMGYLDSVMLVTLDKQGFVSGAIYRNAIFFISVLQMPYKAMFSATFPVLAAAFKDNDAEKVKDIFNRSSLNMLVGATFMVVLIFCNLNNAIALMPSGYEIIKPLYAILIIGCFTDMATGMNSQILSISLYYRFNFYSSAILVVLLVALNLVLIPRIGIYGAAWSNSIALMLFNIAKFLFAWKKLDLQPFSKNTLLVLLAGIPALVVGYYFPYLFNPMRHIYMHSFIDAAIRSSLVLIVYLLMLFWLKPSKDLEDYVHSIKKNKRLF